MSYCVIDSFNMTLVAANAALNNTRYEGAFEDKLFNILSGMLKNVKKTFPDAEWYAVWDTYGGTSFRKRINPEYKATRDHSKIDFKAVEACKSIYELYGITNIVLPEAEADDVIYVLCKRLHELHPQDSITIFSRDRDMIQIVQKHYASNLYDFSKKKYVDIPEYSIIDFKSLVGDPADNIKGVPKIGEKTAIKILNGLQTLTEEQRSIFEKCKDIVDMSRNPSLEKNYQKVVALIN